MNNNVIVSIICTTYNQEKFISDALNGFLNQKTSFKYEIIVHDDASTDKTAQIIQTFVMQYPNLIKPIFQKENIYSRSPRLCIPYAVNEAQGKYLALCEGDDYWIDPYKLQKQVDFLESNPNVSVCVHSANAIDAETGESIRLICRSKENRIYSVKEVIAGGGGLFPTNSMCFRHEFFSNLPDFYFRAPVGDYPLMIHLALQGDVYYMKDTMSVYRQNVPGSWSNKAHSTQDRKYEHIQEISNMFDEINQYTNYKYQDVIEKRVKEYYFKYFLKYGKLEQARSVQYKDFYKQLSLKRKVILQLRSNFPIILLAFSKTNKLFKKLLKRY